MSSEEMSARRERDLPPEEDEDLREVLAELWSRYRPSIIGQVEVLEEAVHELGQGRLSDPARRHAEGEAHKLAGSLGSFGFPHGTDLARELELTLASPGGPAVSEAPHLAERVSALRRELDSQVAGAGSGTGGEEVSADKPALLLVGADHELAERLSVEAQGRHFRPISAATSAAARRLVATNPPRGAVVDVSFAEDAEDDLGLLDDLARHQPPIPVLVLTSGEALIDRVEVARRGGCGFLERGRPPSQVIDGLSEAVKRHEAPQAKLLAVDDDAAFLGTLEALLARHGLAVTTVNDPLRLREALDEVRPDILLLDLNMPGLDGVDLCQAVRADARFALLPVLFLTVLTDTASVQRVFEAGADDYVSKPIVESELLTRIDNRLERVRLFRQLAERDSLTGLANRRRASTRLEDFIAMSDRFGEPVAVALLDLDDFKRLNDDLGHAAGDAALRRVGELLTEASRTEDVIGRWGGEEFVIGMFGMARDDGVRRVRGLLEALRGEAITGREGARACLSFSAGVAEYPRDGRNLHELYLAVDKALYSAKAAGRGQVVAAGSAATTASAEPGVAKGAQDGPVVLTART